MISYRKVIDFLLTILFIAFIMHADISQPIPGVVCGLGLWLTAAYRLRSWQANYLVNLFSLAATITLAAWQPVTTLVSFLLVLMFVTLPAIYQMLRH
jgi:hypothetical protein